MKNKIILFLVEGVSEDISLGIILNRLLKSHRNKNNRNILFYYLDGDITTGIGNATNSIKAEVGRKIKEFLLKYRLQKEDIYKVIQLTDTDGAYAPNMEFY